MRFVLFHQREKPDQPIRQADLAKVVTEEVKAKGASTGIIANAQAKLIAELGLELKKVEVGPARADGKGAGEHSSGGVGLSAAASHQDQQRIPWGASPCMSTGVCFMPGMHSASVKISSHPLQSAHHVCRIRQVSNHSTSRAVLSCLTDSRSHTCVPTRPG